MGVVSVQMKRKLSEHMILRSLNNSFVVTISVLKSGGPEACGRDADGFDGDREGWVDCTGPVEKSIRVCRIAEISPYTTAPPHLIFTENNNLSL